MAEKKLFVNADKYNYFATQSTFMKATPSYFLFFLLLLIIEFLIGIYMHEAVIRPYGGDFLVIILLYCFIKSFFDASVFRTAIGTLMFAYAVEISQYFHLVKLLGLAPSRVALLIMGNSFSFNDLVCYTLGVLLVLLVESIRIGRKLSFLLSGGY